MQHNSRKKLMENNGKGRFRKINLSPIEDERKGRNRGGTCGPGGYCVCTKCGEKVVHQRGVKCTKLKCPRCGHSLVREELLHK